MTDKNCREKDWKLCGAIAADLCLWSLAKDGGILLEGRCCFVGGFAGVMSRRCSDRHR